MIKYLFFVIFLLVFTCQKKYTEPTTGHTIFPSFNNCPVGEIGYLQQFTQCWFLGLNRNVTIGAIGIYSCKPSSLDEIYYVVVTSYPWSCFFNVLVLNNLYGMKEAGEPIVTDHEKIWIEKISDGFSAFMGVGTELVIHYKRGTLEIFINGKLRNTITIPDQEFKRVSAHFKKSAFRETIKLPK